MAMVYRYGSFGTKPESDKGNGFYSNGILLQVLTTKERRINYGAPLL